MLASLASTQHGSLRYIASVLAAAMLTSMLPGRAALPSMLAAGATSLSDSTCSRRMALLGTALLRWLSADRMRGRWPRGGTWSASWPCVLNRHTAAVVTVSRASPCRGQGMCKRTI